MLRRYVVEGFSRDGQLGRRFRHPFVPGNELHPAATFNRAASFFGVAEKILKRFKQKRAEAAAMFIGVLEPIALQNHDKEILGEILRLLHGITVAADEQEDRPPVSSAELGERLARLLLIRV